MPKRIKADNDTWQATLDSSSMRYGRNVVFLCVSNGQRPWRVVRVDEDEIATPEDLEALSAKDLRVLFDRSESMNVSPS